MESLTRREKTAWSQDMCLRALYHFGEEVKRTIEIDAAFVEVLAELVHATDTYRSFRSVCWLACSVADNDDVGLAFEHAADRQALMEYYLLPILNREHEHCPNCGSADVRPAADPPAGED